METTLIFIINTVLTGILMFISIRYIINNVLYTKDKPTCEPVNDITPPFEDKVSCEKCACLLLTHKANKIMKTCIVRDMFYMDLEKYYCNNCKPNYDSSTGVGENVKYHKKLEVTENGEPVGYIKKK